MVGQNWKDGDHDAINRLYRDTSLNQLIFGLLIFIGIWGNVRNIFHMIPDSYAEGRYVIFYMGLANLIIMATGISGTIMTTSSHYRRLALYVVAFGILVLGFNFLLIPKMGIAGAALASAAAGLCYGLMRFLFLWRRYGMQPYTFRHLAAVATAGVAFLPAVWLPDLYSARNHWMSLILDIGIRSLAITLVFSSLMLGFRISPDLNRSWNNLLARLRRK